MYPPGKQRFDYIFGLHVTYIFHLRSNKPIPIML